MTVFDRLEAQLVAAHPQRARRSLPRPAPRYVLAFAAAAVAVAVIVMAGLSGGSSTGASRPAAQPGDAVAPVVRARTNVAVLNAAHTPGRAAHTAVGLSRRGWHITRVTNYPGGAIASSCVDFTPGHSQAATVIARQLGIHTLLPPNPDAIAAAGPNADVIVIIGAH